MRIHMTLSDRFEDIEAIHDALYSYNLSKTLEARVDAAKPGKFPEQAAALACDENEARHGGIAFHWENDPRRIFVDFFFLEESVRGNGLGKEIFEQFLVWAENHGAQEINLTTNTFQAPGFYRKLGFAVTDEKKEPHPGCPENIHYCLRKSLTGK